MGTEEDYENEIWRLEISERREGPLLLWDLVQAIKMVGCFMNAQRASRF